MLKHLCGAAILGAGLALTASQANAVVVVLTDASNLSQVSVEDTTGQVVGWGVRTVTTDPFASQMKAVSGTGMYWRYNGFAESLLSGATSAVQPDGSLTMTFDNAQFSGTVNYRLEDTFGVLPSELKVSASFTAKTDLAGFSIIDFTDLDLNGTPTNDSIVVTPVPSIATQVNEAADQGYDAAYAFQWTRDLSGTLPDNTLVFDLIKKINLDGQMATASVEGTNNTGYDATTAEFARQLGDNDQDNLTNASTVPTGTVIPEPATTALSLLGLGALSMLGLRRRSAR